jgi:hypothetical protein
VTKPLPVVDLDTQIALLIHPERNPTRYQPFARARDFPFEPLTVGVSRVNAWWLADAAWLAYGQSGADIAAVYKASTGLDAELLGVGGTDFTIASNGAFAIVAFRGTQPGKWNDIFADVRWIPERWDEGHVHRGFREAFEAAWPALDARLRRLPDGCPVWFTGHSLGAAVATLAAWRAGRAGGVCTFGSPLVGNQVFTGQFNTRFAHRSARYVNDFDLVTRVPPEPFAFPFGRYTQVDVLRWIDRNGRIAEGGPSPAGFFSDVVGAANASFVLHLMEHLETMGLPALPDALRDHTPLHYVIHVWNDFALHST